MSRENRRIVGRIRRTRLVSALRRARKPRALRPIIAGLAELFRAKNARNAIRSDMVPKARRRLPAWSMLILLLLGAGIGFYASTIVGQVTGSRPSNAPDFTLGSIPGSLTVPQGQVGSFVLSMESLNGFAGSVNLNVSARPSIDATFALNPVSVSLFTGSATATLTVPVPMSAPVNNYLLTVTGVSGRLSHAVTLILQVTPPASPDFQLQAQQSAMNVTRGNSGSTTITLTSIGGFSGIVNMTSSISPGGGSSPTLGLNPNRVTLLSGGTASVVITINTNFGTTRGVYSITAQGVSGSLSNTTTISLTVQ